MREWIDHWTWWFTYRVRTWRCTLLVCDWGDEHYDDYGCEGACAERWRECQRKGCRGWWQTYHYLGGERVYR